MSIFSGDLNHLDLLEQERDKGDRASHAWKSFLEGYVKERQSVYLERLMDTETDLVQLKNEITVVAMITKDITTIIETGSLANLQLNTLK